MTPIPPWFTAWLRGNDTGNSSLTIGFVLLGAEGLLRDPTTPRDTSDVGRCIRLLDLASKNDCDWRGRLGEVAVAVPKWEPLVSRWGDIVAAYHEDAKAQTAARDARARSSRLDRVKDVKAFWSTNVDGSPLLPPSRCWWLVSTLQGHGDPYKLLDPHPFAPREASNA